MALLSVREVRHAETEWAGCCRTSGRSHGWNPSFGDSVALICPLLIHLGARSCQLCKALHFPPNPLSDADSDRF